MNAKGYYFINKRFRKRKRKDSKEIFEELIVKDSQN